MSKRNFITIIIIIAAAVVLAIILYNLLQEPEAADDGLIVVNEISTDAVDGIDIERDGASTSLVREGGSWVYDGGEADALLTETALTQLCYLYASEVIADGVDDPETFGMTDPTMKVTLHTADESYTYLFGTPSSDRESYYLMMDGDPKLYLFPAGNYDQITAGFAAIQPLGLDIDAANLVDIAFSIGGREVALELIPEDERVGNEMWKLTAPVEAPGNPLLVSLVQTLMTPARLNAYVGDEVLDEYGLDDSGDYFYLEDTDGGSVRLIIGNRADDGAYYCIVDGMDGVYTLYKGYEELFDVETTNCIAPNIFPVDVNHVESFTLKFDGNAITFDAEKSQLNGEALSEDQVSELMQALSQVAFDGLTDNESQPKTTDGMEIGDIRISLAPYKNEFLSVSRYGGDAPVYVRKDKIEEIMSVYTK